MRHQHDLRQQLQRLDGKGYKAYKDIRGAYEYDQFQLFIDHVQGDPFAAPSWVRIRLQHDMPAWAFENRSREVALCDFLTRKFARAISRHAKGDRGSGKSGSIFIDRPGQEILERTSVLRYDDILEVRFLVGLPAFGRRIAGKQAQAIFDEELPAIVEDSLFFGALKEADLREHVQTNEDADVLRGRLKELGLNAFVADGALLPRASGVDPRPLRGGVPFKSPESLRLEIELLHRTVTGMGIPEGITLIVGGGYHGKSTLLNALELGVYNHLPDDGRAFVVSDPSATKIRAEDGRYIEGVDISAFINNLPQGRDTCRFRTENASGSTSQAANMVEAIEAGARVLLIDEDTSATNFMIRDHRMQRLVPKEREPITPFIDRARQLYEDRGISSVIVVGGSGMYFDVADKVICMVEYLPRDLTGEAKSIAAEYRDERQVEGEGKLPKPLSRRPAAGSLDPRRGGRVKIRARGLTKLQFGGADIDVSAVEQLVDSSQLNAIGDALLYAKKYMNGKTLPEVLDAVMKDIQEKGLDVLNDRLVGHYARFRRQELAAVLNRLRTLRTEG
jgi:predicted ABC-class ATPase